MRDEQHISIGDTVYYRLEQGPHKGELRPAIVTRVWNANCVNLQVICDPNDGLPCPFGVTSRVGGGLEGQWHWPHPDLPESGADPHPHHAYPVASMAEVAAAQGAATPAEATAAI